MIVVNRRGVEKLFSSKSAKIKSCHDVLQTTPSVGEHDPAKLTNRITDARNAILDRIQETTSVAAHYQECQELTDALNSLRLLRQEYQRRVQQFGEPRTLPRRKAG